MACAEPTIGAIRLIRARIRPADRTERHSHSFVNSPVADDQIVFCSLGELVFRLKNRNDKNSFDPIAETAVQFIKGWAPPFEPIVPVPPHESA